MKVLPVSRFDYDLFPLLEEVIEINDDGSETSMQIEKLGIIDIAEADLSEIRIRKKFNAALDGIEDMTEQEITDATEERAKDDAAVEIDRLTQELMATDRLTTLYLEGKLSQAEWRLVVEERDRLRRRIGGLAAEIDMELPEICRTPQDIIAQLTGG